MTALAGRYVTDTAHFLSVTTEKALIEAADDPQGPESTSESFEELDAEPDSTARDHILAVINQAIVDAEAVVEGFGGAIYALPYAPIDPLVRSLAVRWAWISLRERHGNLTQQEADDARRAIRDFGDRISDKTIRLVSGLLGDASTPGQSEIHAWGSQEQVFSRSRFESGGSWNGNIARKPWEG